MQHGFPGPHGRTQAGMASPQVPVELSFLQPSTGQQNPLTVSLPFFLPGAPAWFSGKFWAPPAPFSQQQEGMQRPLGHCWAAPGV